MKRLQFKRYINEETPIFESREKALEYFSLMTSETDNRHMIGGGLYGEPVVAKYYDVEGNEQLLLGIGVENGYGIGYHIIDSAKLIEDIKTNKDSIDSAIKDLDKVKEAINDNIATIKIVESSSENVKDEYALVNGKDETLGEHIKIYKDNALVDAQIGFKGATGVTEETVDGKKSYKLQYNADEMDKDHEFLYIVYRNEEGALTFVGIDYENFLMEAEFGNGLKVLDHVVSINIMDGEEFLDFDENGAIKTKGIHEAINDSAQSVKDEINTTIDEKINAEAQTRKEQDELLQNQITENKVSSKDIIVEPSATGTKLSLQVDNNTITKTADAETIYDSGIAVLGTLLKIKSVTPSSAAIKKAYQLEGADGKAIGDVIEINKESALSGVEMGKVGDTIDSTTGQYISRGDGNDTLNFIYLENDGTYKLVAVEISKYFTDAHFGKGLSNEDNVISIKEGDGNEYLVVGDDTLSVIGVDAAIAEAAKTTLADAKEYADAQIAKSTEAINNTKIVDVEYNKENNNYIWLKLADGSHTVGFDASVFIKDGMLNDVALDETKNTLTFTWNIDGGEKSTVISLDKFMDIYTSGNDFIGIDGKVITARVDNEGGFANTLASTDFVKNTAADTLAEANKHTDEKIDILNGDYETPGSVVHTISDSIIVNGPTITTVTPEEAGNIHSLIRRVNVVGKGIEYYASSNAKDMFYTKEDGTTVNLNDYIKELEGRVSNIENNLESMIMNALKNVLVGTDKEIKITENNGKMTIGFADDAIFGEV